MAARSSRGTSDDRLKKSLAIQELARRRKEKAEKSSFAPATVSENIDLSSLQDALAGIVTTDDGNKQTGDRLLMKGCGIPIVIDSSSASEDELIQAVAVSLPDDSDDEGDAERQRTPEGERSCSPSAARRTDEGSPGSLGQQANEATELVLGSSGEFRLDGKISSMLYAHQVEGVRWLWSLHRLRKGGILADDMGLGKTLQCCAFLAGMLKSKLIRRAVVVAPKTLLAHWDKELGVVGLSSMVAEFYGSSQSERDASLRQVYRRGGVLLTTYGMVLHNSDQLASCSCVVGRGAARRDEDEDEDHGRKLWDFMILDEGHKVKNPKMQLYQRLQIIPVACRVVISGTPIQNNLNELYALFNLATEGLLGDYRWFKSYYEKPITLGQNKDGNSRQKYVANAKAAELRTTIAPYFLRREKKDVLKTKDSDAGIGEATSNESKDETSSNTAPKMERMGNKNDFIVWLKLQGMQRTMYEAFLHSDAVKQVLNQTGSALAAITVLKKVCDHPALLNKRAADMVIKAARGERDSSADEDDDDDESSDGMSDFIVDDSEEDGSSDDGSAAAAKRRNRKKPTKQLDDDELDSDWLSMAHDPDVASKLMEGLQKTGIEASCKTSFVMGLLGELIGKGHRVLIFSQTRMMLDILQAAINAKRYRYVRIDGTIAKASDRQAFVHRFQASRDIPIFLLTSGVGGVGLTLTAADRVIIVDPSWNPSVDDQSVDRAYRIGQQKDVVVYRLITCGTVEEKIYRNQVFKGGLSRTCAKEGVQFRYFTQQDLRDLFRLARDEVERSITAQQLNEVHKSQRNASEYVKQHMDFLRTLEDTVDISDHDLLFSKQLADEQEQQLPGSYPNSVSVGGHAYGVSSTSEAARRVAPHAGWAGVADLDRHMAEGLRLAPHDDAATQARTKEDAKKREVAQLDAQIARLEAILCSNTPLPDNGIKLYDRVAALQSRRCQLAGEPFLGAIPPAKTTTALPGARRVQHTTAAPPAHQIALPAPAYRPPAITPAGGQPQATTHHGRGDGRQPGGGGYAVPPSSYPFSATAPPQQSADSSLLSSDSTHTSRVDHGKAVAPAGSGGQREAMRIRQAGDSSRKGSSLSNPGQAAATGSSSHGEGAKKAPELSSAGVIDLCGEGQPRLESSKMGSVAAISSGSTAPEEAVGVGSYDQRSGSSSNENVDSNSQRVHSDADKEFASLEAQYDEVKRKLHKYATLISRDDTFNKYSDEQIQAMLEKEGYYRKKYEKLREVVHSKRHGARGS